MWRSTQRDIGSSLTCVNFGRQADQESGIS
jgi:hypothetical protein